MRTSGRCSAWLHGGPGRLRATAVLLLSTSQDHKIILQKDPEYDPASQSSAESSTNPTQVL